MVVPKEMQHAVHDEWRDLRQDASASLPRSPFRRPARYRRGERLAVRLAKRSPAGKDRTLVAQSLPRQVRFKVRISSSSVSTSVASQGWVRRDRRRGEGGLRRARQHIVAHFDAVPDG
jgi:hypothetical protein